MGYLAAGEIFENMLLLYFPTMCNMSLIRYNYLYNYTAYVSQNIQD